MNNKVIANSDTIPICKNSYLEFSKIILSEDWKMWFFMSIIFFIIVFFKYTQQLYSYEI